MDLTNYEKDLILLALHNERDKSLIFREKAKTDFTRNYHTKLIEKYRTLLQKIRGVKNE